jgi:uncharacterized protein (TIGR02117 family)
MFIYYLLIYIVQCFPQIENNERSIYIAKNSWHVGIILEIDESLISSLDAINQFDKFKYVDIGWGDAEFYQSPSDFDLLLAAKAILLPTSSVIRIQGYNSSINEITNWRDYVFEIRLDIAQYSKLCKFLSNSFSRDSTNQLLQTSENFNGIIRYYSSKQDYYLGYTCNTWVAEALEYAGTEVISSNVITAEELFKELIKIGILQKIK